MRRTNINLIWFPERYEGENLAKIIFEDRKVKIFLKDSTHSQIQEVSQIQAT